MNIKKWMMTAALGLAGASASASVVLNEFNAVRDSRWLDEDGTASTKSDAYFGRIEGNGGRWFEALVVGNTSAPGETVDMRGWSFDWADDGTPGSFSLTNHSSLASIHRGTLITFISEDAGGPSVGSNLTGTGTSTAAGGDLAQYDPANGNWWLNINIADNALVDAGGTLFTGNDDWNVEIIDSLGDTVFGPSGENTPTGINDGVNSREVGKLEDSPETIAGWQGVTPSSNYNDGTSSTFGAANQWDSTFNFEQDFSALQAIPEPGVVALFGLSALVLHLLRRHRNA